MSGAVLICDGDAEDRRLLRASLSGFEVVESVPGEARDALARQKFAAVIADELELMQHVRVTYPATLRVLVTGDRELAEITRAVNKGAVHRFFQKPWDHARLRATLDLDLQARTEIG